MSYDKNVTPQYHCIVNNVHSLVAASIPSVKRQASNLLSGSRNFLDAIKIYDYENCELVATLRRINRKAPDGTIKYGKWN